VGQALIPFKKGGGVDMQQEMHWFGVALWRAWYPSALAYADVYVLALGPFSAIETAMQAYQLSSVAYAAADPVGGSLHYRAYKVRIVLDPHVVLEALSFLSGEGPVQRESCYGSVPLRSTVGVCAIDGVQSDLMMDVCYP
jgi:hypothetical protein